MSIPVPKGAKMMKPAAIVLFVLMFFVMPALAESNEPVRTISVTGTVQTQVAPDMIVWRINLSDTHENLS